MQHKRPGFISRPIWNTPTAYTPVRQHSCRVCGQALSLNQNHPECVRKAMANLPNQRKPAK